MRDMSASSVLVQEAERYLSPSMRLSFPEIVVDRGSGSHVFDIEGRSFLDLHSMAGVMNLGYAHPTLTAAVTAQTTKLFHVNSAYAIHTPMIELAKRLTSLAPGDTEKQVAFGLSGSDAIDGAIKLARAATGRSAVVSFAGAYHGNTYGSLSASAVSLNMRRGFAPLLPGMFHIPFPSHADGGAQTFEQLESLFSTLVPADEVAAILVEPIQGDSGVLLPPAGFLARLRRVADEYGILIIADEVQTGIGRTGELLASELFDFVPDILVLGKALGGGLPISAVIAGTELMSAWRAPGHVFSTAAGPIACVAALTVLDVLHDEGLVSAARERGAQFVAGFNAMQEEIPIIHAVRGAGLMIGVELRASDKPSSADRLLAAKVVYGCHQRGSFLTFLAGNVLRIIPPLVITADEVDVALTMLRDALVEATTGRVADASVSKWIGW